MAGEARDQATTIPASIKRVMIAVFTIYFTLPWIALSALPVRCDAAGENCTTLLGVAKEDGGFASNPMLGIVQAMELGTLQGAAELYVGILAVTILVAATNAGVLGVSRLVYSMGMHRQMPDGMRRLHPHFRTPYLGILVFSASPASRCCPGEAEFLGAIYAFGAMLSFSMAHLAVLRLRVTQPDLERPYRSPGSVRIRGHELPPFALRGHAGTGLSLIVVSALDLTVAAAGSGWLALGIASTWSTAAARGSTSSRRTRSRSRSRSSTTRRSTTRCSCTSATSGYDEWLVATAAKVAARKRRGIHVLVTIIVPNSLAIDAPMPEAEAVAESIIEQAKLQAGRRVSGHWEKVRAGPGGAPDHRGGAGHARGRGGARAAASGSPARRCSARRSRRCWPSGHAA